MVHGLAERRRVAESLYCSQPCEPLCYSCLDRRLGQMLLTLSELVAAAAVSYCARGGWAIVRYLSICYPDPIRTVGRLTGRLLLAVPFAHHPGQSCGRCACSLGGRVYRVRNHPRIALRARARHGSWNRRSQCSLGEPGMASAPAHTR